MYENYPFPGLPPKVFISYSHKNREFAEKLSRDLMANGIAVWWDQLEMKVGDSLIKKFENGLSSSSYLCVILSPDSVTSVWVQQELEAAMMRQLIEKRVVVLPVLFKPCKIPLFLQGKFYADFTKDYEMGFRRLLSTINPPDIGSHGRADDAQYFNDYAIEWGVYERQYMMTIDITSHGGGVGKRS